MTGADWPGKSATQSAASLLGILSGRFFSSDIPFCCGPRQASQPWTGEENPKSQAPSPKKIPNTRLQVVGFIKRKLQAVVGFMASSCSVRTKLKPHLNSHSGQPNYSTPGMSLQTNNTYTYD